MKVLLLIGLAFFVMGCAEKRLDLTSSKTTVSIGTGGSGGMYYPTGLALCSLVNKNESDINCIAKTTKGSIDNLRASRTFKIDFGIAQSDWLYHAYNGSSKFIDAGSDTNLRSVFSLYLEPVTLVVRSDLGINSIRDLSGKIINIGRRGSWTEAYWKLIWPKFKKFDIESKKLTHFAAQVAADALCQKEIDAYFWLVGNPNKITADTVNNCDAKIITPDDPVIEKLVSSSPYLRYSTIVGGTYQSIPYDIRTFGVGPTVFTTKDLPEDIVYVFVKSVFENFYLLKRSNSAFITLNKSEMIPKDKGVPIHPGALKYYKEAGLL